MNLKSLHIENFRNYKNLELNLSDSDCVVLIGKNGQGKTNILEAISMLALGKSFRVKKNIDLINWNADFARIKCAVKSKNESLELEVFLQKTPDIKKFKKNDKIITGKRFIANLKTVIFAPDHLEMITGSPNLRRQFMDRLLVQIDYAYIESLYNFQKLLKHRNAILKNINLHLASEEELDFWDQAYANEAYVLWKKRSMFFNAIKDDLCFQYEQISNSKDELSVQVNCFSQDDVLHELAKRRNIDLRSGTSSFGPHRDDFCVYLNDRQLGLIGSRGECRSAVLALKLSELNYLERKTGTNAILLLDDVFSELDAERQAQLLVQLQGRQSFLTSTNSQDLKNLNLSCFEVKNGELFIAK